MVLGGNRGRIELLTRSTRGGVPYQRPTAVEAQIRDALAMSQTEFVARAAVADRSSSAHLTEECLVYLVRAAARADDLDGFNTATDLLLRRCARRIDRSFRTLGVVDDDRADLQGEVVATMLEHVVADDGRGDFYQVRFGSAIKRLLLKVYDQYDRRRQREGHQESLSAPVGSADESDDDGPVLEAFVGSPEDIAADVERRMLIAEGLDAIRDPRHREAFVLLHYDGWPIETSAPAEPSISAVQQDPAHGEQLAPGRRR